MMGKTYEQIKDEIGSMKNHVVDVIMQNICGDGYDAYARAYNIIEALKISDKYQWHDLRKNPEDLPKDYKDVYVYFEYFRYGEYNGLYRTYGISYCYDGKFIGFVNGTSGWRELKILAWREIEPFEEVE